MEEIIVGKGNKMGADGYLINLSESKDIKFICYRCGLPVDKDNPIKNHEDCTCVINDKEALKVDIEIKDFTGR